RSGILVLRETVFQTDNGRNVELNALGRLIVRVWIDRADTPFKCDNPIQNIVQIDVGQVNGGLESDLTITIPSHSKVGNASKLLLVHGLELSERGLHPVALGMNRV